MVLEYDATKLFRTNSQLIYSVVGIGVAVILIPTTINTGAGGGSTGKHFLKLSMYKDEAFSASSFEF